MHLGNVKCLQVNATLEVQRIQLKDLNMFYEKSNGLPKGQKWAKCSLWEEKWLGPKDGGLKCVGKGAREWKMGSECSASYPQEGAPLKKSFSSLKVEPIAFSAFSWSRFSKNRVDRAFFWLKKAHVLFFSPI